MNDSPTMYRPALHFAAWLTAAAALLLPIPIGALVTTTDSGMAVQGWLIADGYTWWDYPWFQVAWDKFIEHGHRLAGASVGLASLLLAGIALWQEPRRWVRGLCVTILLAVITQGVLGGQRVLLDSRGLAFVHGWFASWVFGAMTLAVICTSRLWLKPPTVEEPRSSWKWMTLGLMLLINLQYLLGGLVRHQGTVIHEHLGMGFVVFAAGVFVALRMLDSDCAWLVRPACVLALLLTAQVVLGLGTYVVKFGWGEGFVVQQGSTLQILVRTAHVWLGMLVWMHAVILAARTWRVCQQQPVSIVAPQPQPYLAGGMT